MPYNGYLYIVYTTYYTLNSESFFIIYLCDEFGNNISEIIHIFRPATNLLYKNSMFTPLLKAGTYFKVLDILNSGAVEAHQIIKAFY